MPRIVAMADTHLFHSRIEVPDGDVLIHAGDMCGNGGLVELVRAATWLGSMPHAHKIVIAGNHDTACEHEPHATRSIMRDAGLTYLQDSEVTVAGLRIYGSPWQPEFCNWAFNLPRGPKLDAVWAQIPEGLDVLVTHGPPYGIGDRVFSYCDQVRVFEHAGCADLLRHVQARPPKLHVFGHIHCDPGVWEIGPTLFANVNTSNGVLKPMVFDAPQGAP